MACKGVDEEKGRLARHYRRVWATELSGSAAGTGVWPFRVFLGRPSRADLERGFADIDGELSEVERWALGHGLYCERERRMVGSVAHSLPTHVCAASLDELAQAGARRILVLPTSAYASYSGCRQYREDLAEAAEALREKWGTIVLGAEDSADNPDADIVLDKVRPYYSTPGMARAQITSIRRSWEALTARGVDPSGIRLIFVTHSIPVSMEAGSSPFPFRSAIDEATAASGDHGERQGSAASSEAGTPATEISYVAQHHALIGAIMPELRRVLGRVDLGYDLVYCSRSGPPQARWLEPDVNDHLEALAVGQLTDGSPADRPGGVVVAPFGFISDHMEVVFDLDTEAAQTARDLGMPYARAATVGTHPAFVDSLVDILIERAAVARGEDVHPASTTGVGPFHTVCPDSCCRPGPRHPGRPGQPNQHGHHGTDGAGPR